MLHASAIGMSSYPLHKALKPSEKLNPTRNRNAADKRETSRTCQIEDDDALRFSGRSASGKDSFLIILFHYFRRDSDGEEPYI